jgi:hypothetical protein
MLSGGDVEGEGDGGAMEDDNNKVDKTQDTFDAREGEEEDISVVVVTLETGRSGGVTTEHKASVGGVISAES